MKQQLYREQSTQKIIKNDKRTEYYREGVANSGPWATCGPLRVFFVARQDRKIRIEYIDAL
jgi:hypothetical protein